MDEPTYDPPSIYLGVIVVAMTGLFAFWGARGLWQYTQGVRAESADPVISSVALMAVPWLAAIARKLLRRHPYTAQLLTGPELLVGSLVALAGAIGSILGDFGDSRFTLVALGVAAGGIYLWSRRARRPAVDV